MTSRERLLAAMQGRPCDRVPIAPFIYGNAVRARFGENADLIDGTIAYCEHYGFDLILRNFNIRHSDFAVGTDDWRVFTASAADGANTVRRTQIQTPDGTLSQTVVLTALSPFETVSACREHLIKSEADLALLERYMPPVCAPDLADLRRAKQAVADKGILAPWTFGVFNYMAELRDVQDILMDLAVDPDFYHRLARYALERLKAALAPVLRQGVDMVSYTGNLANAVTVGPRFFERFVLPYERELVRFLQDGGCGVIYHNCGDGANLIDCYNQLKPRCYESMTEPPYADHSLAQCFREFDPDITLMGNIDQITFLRTASPQEVRQKARSIAKAAAAAHPRFILGTSDFIKEDTPPQNLFALAHALD